MPIISQQSLDLVVALINASNPGLPVPVTDTNVNYAAPTAITPASGAIQNTQLQVFAKNIGEFTGHSTLTYRRLDLSALLRALPIVISAITSAADNVSPFNISDLLTAINTKYGLSLQASDIVDAALPAGNTNAVPGIGLVAGTRNSNIVVNANPTSLGYVGSFTLYWIKILEEIAAAIAASPDGPVLAGKLYPGGNTFAEGRLPQGDILTYGLDCTSISTALLALASSQVVTEAEWQTAGSGYAQILSFLQQKIPALSFNGDADSAQGGLGGLTLSRVTLPSTSVPGANSAVYTNVTTIQALSTSWFQGMLYLHYN